MTRWVKIDCYILALLDFGKSVHTKRRGGVKRGRDRERETERKEYCIDRRSEKERTSAKRQRKARFQFLYTFLQRLSFVSRLLTRFFVRLFVCLSCIYTLLQQVYKSKRSARKEKWFSSIIGFFFFSLCYRTLTIRADFSDRPTNQSSVNLLSCGRSDCAPILPTSRSPLRRRAFCIVKVIITSRASDINTVYYTVSLAKDILLQRLSDSVGSLTAAIHRDSRFSVSLSTVLS